MSTNKNATIRYNALDNAFRNPGRRYFIEDLIEVCNKALYEFNASSEGVGKRQIYDDIRFMESEQGWSIPLEKKKEGRKVFYRYFDLKFSIQNEPLNEIEAKELKETLSILSKIKGLPKFEWVDEMILRLENVFGLNRDNVEVISFEQNIFLKGITYLSDLFSAIQYKKVLKIEYKSYRKDVLFEYIISPYYLKQYNNRWFLFGYNKEINEITNIALDRIITIDEISEKYIENTFVDFNEYFEDVIGVTINKQEKEEKIQLKINKKLWPYIESKPLHGSQKVIDKADEFVVIELELKINIELISVIFRYAENVIVLKPEKLRNIIKIKAKNIVENYF